MLEGITHAKILEKGNPRFSFGLGKVLKEKPPSIIINERKKQLYKSVSGNCLSPEKQRYFLMLMEVFFSVTIIR